jgi:uncharacterized phage protein (TIGR01671 family)
MTIPLHLKFWCSEHGFVASGFDEAITEVHFNQRGELGLACPLCFKSRPMTIVCSTGLKDKEGMEIYEGDVISVKLGPTNKPYVVEWSDEKVRFVFRGVRYNVGAHVSARQVRNGCRVKGNIHENPELLEMKS